MISAIVGFLRKNNRKPDLAEYCAMTALVALIGLGVFYHMSGGMPGR